MRVVILVVFVSLVGCAGPKFLAQEGLYQVSSMDQHYQWECFVDVQHPVEEWTWVDSKIQGTAATYRAQCFRGLHGMKREPAPGQSQVAP